MKKLILSCIAGAMFVSVNSLLLQAQNQAKQTKPEVKSEKAKLTPEQRAEKQTEHFTKWLNLTDGQVPKVKMILLERAQTADKDFERCKGDKDCLRLARRDRNAVADKRLKEVLSPEQYAKLLEKRKEAKEKKIKKLEKEQGKRNKEELEDELNEVEFSATE
jgi:hypothetical protein